MKRAASDLYHTRYAWRQDMISFRPVELPQDVIDAPSCQPRPIVVRGARIVEPEKAHDLWHYVPVRLELLCGCSGSLFAAAEFHRHPMKWDLRNGELEYIGEGERLAVRVTGLYNLTWAVELDVLVGRFL